MVTQVVLITISLLDQLFFLGEFLLLDAICGIGEPHFGMKPQESPWSSPLSSGMWSVSHTVLMLLDWCLTPDYINDESRWGISVQIFCLVGRLLHSNQWILLGERTVTKKTLQGERWESLTLQELAKFLVWYRIFTILCPHLLLKKPVPFECFYLGLHISLFCFLPFFFFLVWMCFNLVSILSCPTKWSCISIA